MAAISGSDKALTHARAGVARAGASRLNYFAPIVPVLTIDGTDRSAQAVAGSFRVSLNAFDQPDMLTGRCKAAAGWTPAAGQSLVLGIGQAENRVFGGRIQALTKLYVSKPSLMFYDFLAVDGTDTLAKRLALKHYISTDAADIVRDLIATYTSGITTAHVEGGLGTIDDITFTMERIPDCLTRICDRIDGCRWYVDEYGDLFFGTTIPATPAPASLTNAQTVPFRNVALRRDLSQIRTRVYVEGRGGQLTEYQTPLTAGPTADLFVDTPSELFDDPDGSTYYVRWKTLILPYTEVTDSPSPDVLTGTNDGVTLARASAEGRAREGDEVNVWVQVDDLVAQDIVAAAEGGDGIREMYVQDRRLSKSGAELRGQAELATYNTIVDTLTYETTDVNARPGRDVAVNLTGDFEMSGSYRIQSVSIDAIGSTRTQFPWRMVTATSKATPDVWMVLKRSASPTFIGGIY